MQTDKNAATMSNVLYLWLVGTIVGGVFIGIGIDKQQFIAVIGGAVLQALASVALLWTTLMTLARAADTLTSLLIGQAAGRTQVRRPAD